MEPSKRSVVSNKVLISFSTNSGQKPIKPQNPFHVCFAVAPFKQWKSTIDDILRY